MKKSFLQNDRLSVFLNLPRPKHPKVSVASVRPVTGPVFSDQKWSRATGTGPVTSGQLKAKDMSVNIGSLGHSTLYAALLRHGSDSFVRTDEIRKEKKFKFFKVRSSLSSNSECSMLTTV